MSKKKIAAVLASIAGVSVLGVASLASAHGFGMGFNQSATPEEIAERHTQMFTQHAELLGVSVETVKAAWAEGKTLRELAEVNGITPTQLQEKMKSARQAQMKEHLSTLVSKGVITQAQADSRLSSMQNMTNQGMGRGKGMRGGGFGF